MSKKNKKQKIFSFTFPNTPDELKGRIKETVFGEDMLYEETEQGFDLGVERGGHSGGHWYCAAVTEGEGHTVVTGEIVYRSLHNDGKYRENSRAERIWENISLALLIVFLLIPILIVFAVVEIIRLVGKLRGKPVKKTMTTEEKLTYFMIETVGCREDE